MDDRLDLISLANSVRIGGVTSAAAADVMTGLIGDLCDKRISPVSERLGRRQVETLRRYDAALYSELAARHGGPGGQDEDA